jgi:hypothetical protein
MDFRPLALGDSELMAQHQDLASFQHDSRRDKPSTDTARDTIRKTSFKPASRRSSRLRPGQDRPGDVERQTEPTATCRKSAQVTQVFGTQAR